MAGQKKAIETGFPYAELSRVAEAESWRKELNRPLAHIHKWWGHRSNFCLPRHYHWGVCRGRRRRVESLLPADAV